MEEIRQILERFSVSGYSSGGSLESLCRIAKIKKPSRKTDIINALMVFYTQPGCVEMIVKQLDNYERKLIECIVECNYIPYFEDYEKLVVNQKHKNSYYYSRSGISSYFPENSKLYLLYLGCGVPQCIRTELNGIISKPVRSVTVEKDIGDVQDYSGAIIGRENRLSDFDLLVKFVNTQKVSATAATGLMGKSSIVKFHKIAKYDEVYADDLFDIEDVRSIKDTTVSYGMVALLLNAKVFVVSGGRYGMGEKATYYAGLNRLDKVKFLLEEYKKHNNTIIDECLRITANKYQFSKKRYSLKTPVDTILEYLKICPVMEWVDGESFGKILRKDAHFFLRDELGEVYIRDSYNKQYYDNPDWNELERYFINIVLMEYLGTMGLVDYVTEEESDEYGNITGHVLKYFRLSELGAYLLGLTNLYELKTETSVTGASGFSVLPNYEIVIPEGQQRMAHELYFDRFLTRINTDKQVTIYTLDFKGIVKALDCGIELKEIYHYLKNCSSVPVPENVSASFEEWIVQSKRIKIRNVTIIETDDEFLFEEIKNYKGIKSHTKDIISNGLVILPEDVQKAKKEIEKNKRFVDIGIL